MYVRYDTKTAAALWHTPLWYEMRETLFDYLAVGKRGAGESVDVRRASALHRQARRGCPRGRNRSHGHRRDEGGRGRDEGSGSAEERLGGNHAAAFGRGCTEDV